jgi:adenylyl-sulfate kinase
LVNRAYVEPQDPTCGVEQYRRWGGAQRHDGCPVHRQIGDRDLARCRRGRIGRRNRSTGHYRLAGAVARRELAAAPAARAGVNIARARREARHGHRAGVAWFTGLSGSGKSTLARALERRLFALGCRTVLLDGDALRRGLSNDLGFSPADRMENIRRAAEVARLFYDNGCRVLCAFVSPFRRDRDFARRRIGRGRFLEIHADCPLEECRRRDTKGLYAAAGAGALGDLTGVGQAYEAPAAAEFVARAAARSPEAIVEESVALLRARSILPAAPKGRARAARV